MQIIETPAVKRSRWSVLGCVEDMQRDIVAFGNSIWHEHGDYVHDRFLNKPCLFLFHPEALEHVLQKQNKLYSKDVSMFNAMKVLLGNGLATSEGELWLKQRRMIQPFFHRGRVDAFVPLMIDAAVQFLRSVKPGTIVEMQDEMGKMTLSITVHVLFQQTNLNGLKFAQDLKGIGPDITSYMRLPFPPLVVPTPRNRRLKQKIQLLDQHIQHVIEERKRQPLDGEPDILQTLIEKNDHQQVRDEMLTLVIAGYQTTALSLSFAWSLLAQHPEIEHKLHTEIERVLGDRELTEEDLPKLVYARSILMETLRLYPASFGLIRQSLEEDTICGHNVAAGTVICMAPYFTHRHPDFWHDPERFDPERFLAECERHRFAYVPFGAGPHQCIGKHFALLEALTILVMVSQRYDVRFAEPSFQPEVQALAVMKMKELPMVFEARRVKET